MLDDSHNLNQDFLGLVWPSRRYVFPVFAGLWFQAITNNESIVVSSSEMCLSHIFDQKSVWRLTCLNVPNIAPHCSERLKSVSRNNARAQGHGSDALFEGRMGVDVEGDANARLVPFAVRGEVLRWEQYFAYLVGPIYIGHRVGTMGLENLKTHRKRTTDSILFFKNGSLSLSLSIYLYIYRTSLKPWLRFSFCRCEIPWC